jgi:hypothetical protein
MNTLPQQQQQHKLVQQSCIFVVSHETIEFQTCIRFCHRNGFNVRLRLCASSALRGVMNDRIGPQRMFRKPARCFVDIKDGLSVRSMKLSPLQNVASSCTAHCRLSNGDADKHYETRMRSDAPHRWRLILPFCRELWE